MKKHGNYPKLAFLLIFTAVLLFNMLGCKKADNSTEVFDPDDLSEIPINQQTPIAAPDNPLSETDTVQSGSQTMI